MHSFQAVQCGSCGSSMPKSSKLVFVLKIFVAFFGIAQPNVGEFAWGVVGPWGAVNVFEARDTTDVLLEVLWHDTFSEISAVFVAPLRELSIGCAVGDLSFGIKHKSLQHELSEGVGAFGNLNTQPQTTVGLG